MSLELTTTNPKRSIYLDPIAPPDERGATYIIREGSYHFRMFAPLEQIREHPGGVVRELEWGLDRFIASQVLLTP